MDGQHGNGKIGDRTRRVEDPRLVTGKAKFTDDLSVPGVAHAAVLRSKLAHARIRDIDTREAESLEGVIAVFTAEDMNKARTPPPRKIPTVSTDYIQIDPELFRPVIASGRVRYQGEPLAIVVAENRYLAHDALDLISVDYDPLQSVTDPNRALEEDAPILFEGSPDNLAFEWEQGEPAELDRIFERAPHTVSISIDEQRMIPNPLENRTALAEYDSSTDELRIRMSTQTPHSDRHAMAGILRHPENKIHIIVPQVGGGFGAKIHNYDIESLVPWCARELERPIKWQARRSETHLASSHGRGLDFTGEMALNEEGKILGLKVDGLADIGGYVASHIHMLTTVFCVDVIPGQYDVPALHARIRGALTNCTPLDSFRGVHEVTAITLIERLMDEAAHELEMDPAALRSRNQMTPDAFPCRSVTGLEYDSGNFQQAMSEALDAVEYDQLRTRQAELRQQGRYLGIGLSCYAHVSGIAPADVCRKAGLFKTHWETGRMTIHQSGTVTAYCGTQDFGQGHETIYSQVLSDTLGIPLEDIKVIEGDTRHLNDGLGTHASRSAVVGGSALVHSAREVIEKARTIAAYKLEASERDVEFDAGNFHVTGAPHRSITIQKVAREAHRALDIPGDPGLEATKYYLPDKMTITAGTHVAVVEVDPETGQIRFERYVAVDDIGNRINPTIVEGQLHGGIAQGISQALLADVVYDDNGNMVTSSLMDYAMPRSTNTPDMETREVVTPAPDNPLGARGVGESGPIAANAAVLNAVVDALRPLGFDGRVLDTPLTPQKIWKRIAD